jgi:hypothetical protein
MRFLLSVWDDEQCPSTQLYVWYINRPLLNAVPILLYMQDGVCTYKVTLRHICETYVLPRLS